MVRRLFPAKPPLPFLGAGLILLITVGCLGCRGGDAVGTTDPEAKLRLERLLEYYNRYADQKGKGPANEQALKDFLRKLSKEDQERARIGDDVDRFLVSPRDGQKFGVRYNLTIDRNDGAQAVAWEQTGSRGNRFVALAAGYVEECDEQSFKQLKK